MVTYLIGDGRGNFIRQDINGNWAQVRSMALAEVFKDRAKAKNVLNSSISKNLRKKFKVIEQYQNDWEPKKEVQKKTEETIKPNNDYAKVQCEKTAGDPQEWESRLEPFREFVNDVENRRSELLEQLSKVDLEVSDIQHYIEFGRSFNAYQGYMAFKMLQQTLKRRRVIKDEYTILQQLGDCKISMEALDSVRDCAGRLHSRKYTPRVLKELFE